MNLILRIFILISSLRAGYGVIYHLNATEFNRMPPLYKLDHYNSCLQKQSDVYCTIFFKLVSEEQLELFHMIEEYSENNKTHFDHTKLRYGVCVTQSCQQYIHDNASVSEVILEGCLNKSFWENYQLKTRIKRYSCYSSSDNEITVDKNDLIVGIVLFTIIMLSVVGSLYDIYCTSNKRKDIHFLQLLSLQRNWRKLTSTKLTSDSRFQNLKGINGIRCIGQVIVIGVHCGILLFFLANNIYDIELSYKTLGMNMIIGGPIMLQTYFVISAFFLTYNLEVYAEKHSINWRTVLKGILLRYIRLTPSYALVILLIATWFKFVGPGPLWEIIGKAEMMDCKNRWWISLLYVNNYVYDFRCIITSWYLAADMQLFCCGLILYVLLKNNRSKNTILVSLIALGSIVVAVHTYVRDLDHYLFLAPSSTSEIFAGDPTYNETYRMGHANICSYVIGMALGYFVYSCQQKKINLKHYVLFKYFYWTVGPIFVGVVMSGGIFYRDGPREPVYMRALYAALSKPIAGLSIAIFIAGTVLKVDNFYRKILELDVWIILSRLTYSAYLVHFPLLVIYVTSQMELLQATTFYLMALIILVNVVSFIIAIPLYLFVESPCKELIKYFVMPTKEEAVVASDCKEAVADDRSQEAMVVNGQGEAIVDNGYNKKNQ